MLPSTHSTNPRENQQINIHVIIIHHLIQFVKKIYYQKIIILFIIKYLQIYKYTNPLNKILCK